MTNMDLTETLRRLYDSEINVTITTLWDDDFALISYMEWEEAGRPPSGSRPREGTSIGKRTMSTGEVEEWPRYAIGSPPPDFEGDIEYTPLWAGESCSVVNEIKPAADIVRDLVRDAEVALR